MVSEYNNYNYQKGLEINTLKDRIQQNNQCNHLQKNITQLDKEQYDVKKELTIIIDTLRNSVPKKSISTSIFDTFHSLLYDAILDDIKNETIFIMYNYIIVENNVGRRYQEYEIRGKMYIITNEYIYELCSLNNGIPIRRFGVKSLFTINKNGILLNGIETFGFIPIGIGFGVSTKINPYIFPFVENYLKNSIKQIGTTTKEDFQKIQLLHKKLYNIRELLILMFCEL